MFEIGHEGQKFHTKMVEGVQVNGIAQAMGHTPERVWCRSMMHEGILGRKRNISEEVMEERT